VTGLVPDSFDTEPRVGWRRWRFDLATRRLHSPFFQAAMWPPFQRIEATCHDALTPNHVGGPRIPNRDCTCGIWVGDRDRMEEDYWETMAEWPITGGRVLVFGRASLWGHTVPHEYGWRGQYGYPYDILVPGKIERPPSAHWERPRDTTIRTSYDPEEVMNAIRETYVVDVGVL
jgi:hypothetical protein